MNLWATALRPRRAGRLAAALALLLWLVTLVCTVSPQLHLLLHADAQQSNHACLITQLQQQGFLGVVEVLAAPAAPLADGSLVGCRAVQFLPSWDYRLSPSRAPPSAGFSCLA